MAMKKKRTVMDFFKVKDSICLPPNPAPVPDILEESEMQVDVPFSMMSIVSEMHYKIRKTDGSMASTSASTPAHSKFLYKWFKEFSWVTFDEESKRMFCILCKKHNMKIGIATIGSSCFQKNTLIRHEKSKEHKFAVSTKKDTVAMHNAIDKAKSNSTEGELVVFKTVYMIAKEEIPQTKFKSIMMLQKSNGNSLITEEHLNLHHTSISEIETTMSDLLESSLDTDIRQSQFISILLDESTDIGVDHKLIIYVRYMKNGEPKISLWTNLKLSGECSAQTLTETLTEFLKLKEIPLTKIIGLATDGAAVMMGIHNGLGKQLQDIIPSLFHYNCISHRLALAISQAAAGISLFDLTQRTLSGLYVYFHTSTIRFQKLKLMQDIMDVKH